MQRLRLFDVTTSRLPQAVGLCTNDRAGIANIVNSAQRRLLFSKEAGEEGWVGGWAEIMFTVSATNPFLTFDNSIARLEFVDVCDFPVTVNNQFVEYLRFGNGRLPKIFQQGHTRCFRPQVYSRNWAPTFTDLSPAPQFIVAFGDSSDFGKRVLIQGPDNNGNTVFTQDGQQRVVGQWEALNGPFTTWPQQWNAISGIQKDVTNFPVNIFQMDPNTGAQVLLATMQPQETTAWYRRYFFNPLPFNCCSGVNPGPCVTPNQAPQNITVTAIVKLEFQPVVFDTDYLLIQELEAIIEECQAVRYSTMDTSSSKNLETASHKKAIRLLNGQIAHYYGIDNPAINVAVFGSARLERHAIGTML